MNRVAMVIGSWGSYNECNERALGSEWLDFDDYEDWDEIVEELKREGFELDGIDEELFVQDIEGVPTSSTDWDTKPAPKGANANFLIQNRAKLKAS